MAKDRFYSVKIEILTDNDGAAYLDKGPQTTTETLPVDKACDRYGRERVANLLLAALERVRSHVAK